MTMMLPRTMDTVAALRAEFDAGAGYLSACTTGIPMVKTREAIATDLAATPDIGRHVAAVDRTRGHIARLTDTSPGRVAVASQTAVFAAMVAANLPDGAEVLCPEHEFSSIVLPFVHAGRGIRVRTAPLHALADAITSATTLVSFSLVQSATGEVADLTAIRDAAAQHGSLTFCDATQALGWLPVSAGDVDLLVCHAYKWLCAPRGAAYLIASSERALALRPTHANWYAGDDPWASCYGADAVLSRDARRFDLSPAGLAFVGAEPALAAFADCDAGALRDATTSLAAAFRAQLDLPEPVRSTPIVTWADPDGCSLAALTAAGITASGRNGCARIAFHVFNDEADVERAVLALRGIRS